MVSELDSRARETTHEVMSYTADSALLHLVQSGRLRSETATCQLSPCDVSRQRVPEAAAHYSRDEQSYATLRRAVAACTRSHAPGESDRSPASLVFCARVGDREQLGESRETYLLVVIVRSGQW